jgi:hypothetical protein
MRLPAILCLLLIAAMPAALAAPTCQDRSGMTMRCGAEGAMPVGWTAPDRDRHVPKANSRDIWEAAAAIILLFALIALLPDFDGSSDSDWDPKDDAGRRR